MNFISISKRIYYKEDILKDNLEKEWISPEGYRCAVLIHPAAGNRMGYIFIPANDKAYREPEY